MVGNTSKFRNVILCLFLPFLAGNCLQFLRGLIDNLFYIGRRDLFSGTFFIPVFREKKVKAWSQDWLIAVGTYPGFCSMKRLGVFLLPLDGMLVHRRSLPSNLLVHRRSLPSSLLGFSPNNWPVPIYTPGWREAL